jgi:carboxypeptidase family protein
VLDFDACKSVVKAGNSGQYILKPVLTVVPRSVTGVKGFVSTTLPLSSTTVAAQQNGVTIRSTMPDSTGMFSIPFLPTGTYTLVITADGRATGVITGVPAVTATTVINGTATAITLPVSTMADVTGTVSVTSVSGTSTVTLALTDATVRALQPLTGGPVIELGSQAVDAVLGTYRFRLPVGAPMTAAYGPVLAFAPDAAAAGKYTIQVQSPGRLNLEAPANISGGTSMMVNFNYGP